MGKGFALYLLLMAGLGTCENNLFKFNVLQPTPSTEPPTTFGETKDNNYFRESLSNLTGRKEEAAVNLAAVDLLLDAVDEAITNDEVNVTIPEDIDPEQRPISVKDAVDRVVSFMSEQSIEVQSLLEDIDHLLDEIKPVLKLNKNWLQRTILTNTEVKILWLKRDVTDLYRNYTEAVDDISKIYNSLSRTDMDFEDDYDYPPDSTDVNAGDSEDNEGSSGESSVDETTTFYTTSSLSTSESPTTSVTYESKEYGSFEMDNKNEEYNSGDGGEQDSGSFEDSTFSTIYPFSDLWRLHGSGGGRESNREETETASNWPQFPHYSDDDKYSWLDWDWSTMSTTTFSSLPVFNWDSPWYDWDSDQNTDNEKADGEVYYYADSSSNTSNVSGVYAGAIIGAVILKITFWVMIIRCRYRYRNRIRYTTTLRVNPRNLRTVRNTHVLRPRVFVVDEQGVVTISRDRAPSPPDDLPTYGEAVANDAAPPPKYEECQNDSCGVDLASPDDLPKPPAYTANVQKEEDELTTTSDVAPLILEEI